jgi:tRNA (adenine22-N1)-methyltransferase
MSKFSDRIVKLASYVNVGETVADIGPDHGYLGVWLVKNEVSPRVIMTDIAEGPLAIARANAERYAALSLQMRSDHPCSNTESRCFLPPLQTQHDKPHSNTRNRCTVPHAAMKESGVMDFRLGDGLTPLEPSEVDTVVIAGMGGETIIGILEADPAKTRSFPKYILQPRTKTELLRAWLNGSANKTSRGSSGEFSKKNFRRRTEPTEGKGKHPGFVIVAEDTAIERGRNCEIIVAETL